MGASASFAAARTTKMPDGIFAHRHGESFETGTALVLHPYTKAVGFTGSFSGGKALYDLSNHRKEPIPVFAEMGSVNPVFLLPEKLSQSAEQTAKMYAASVTASVGQFCTNPGILIGIKSEGLDRFLKSLSDEIKNIAPGTMLHPGIAKAFVEKRQKAISQNGVHVAAVSSQQPQENQGLPTIATVDASEFLKNALLHQEVFGPYSILVICEDDQQMIDVALHLEGQLTSTIIATENDVQQHESLIEAIKNICGRFIMNGVPTGVEVCLSMNHGGPYPATTDSRFTSVGADGIKRFVRPISFQNWPDSLLPDELKNNNPLGIWRTINDSLTKEKI
jgi:NADP-dependent aldehyde dehydrogenase